MTSTLPSLAWLLGGLLLLAGVLVILGAARYRRLTNRIGAFICDLRKGRLVGREPRKFAPGVACYGIGRLDWFTAWSLSPLPAISWPRESFEIMQREPAPGRRGEYLVSCRSNGSYFDLLMSASAYSGLASWLEAAPTAVPVLGG